MSTLLETTVNLLMHAMIQLANHVAVAQCKILCRWSKGGSLGPTVLFLEKYGIKNVTV